MVSVPSCNTQTRFVCTVEVTVKARKVPVKGERGTVTKDFSHLAVELQKMKQDNK